jgi:hypothetical protein
MRIFGRAQQSAERRLSVESKSQYRGIAAAPSQGHGFLPGEASQQHREGSQKKYVAVCRKRRASLGKGLQSIICNLVYSLGQRNGCRAGPAICRQVAKQFVSEARCGAALCNSLSCAGCR